MLLTHFNDLKNAYVMVSEITYTHTVTKNIKL